MFLLAHQMFLPYIQHFQGSSIPQLLQLFSYSSQIHKNRRQKGKLSVFLLGREQSTNRKSEFEVAFGKFINRQQLVNSHFLENGNYWSFLVCCIVSLFCSKNPTHLASATVTVQEEEERSHSLFQCFMSSSPLAARRQESSLYSLCLDGGSEHKRWWG